MNARANSCCTAPQTLKNIFGRSSTSKIFEACFSCSLMSLDFAVICIATSSTLQNLCFQELGHSSALKCINRLKLASLNLSCCDGPRSVFLSPLKNLISNCKNCQPIHTKTSKVVLTISKLHEDVAYQLINERTIVAYLAKKLSDTMIA